MLEVMSEVMSAETSLREGLKKIIESVIMIIAGGGGGGGAPGGGPTPLEVFFIG